MVSILNSPSNKAGTMWSVAEESAGMVLCESLEFRSVHPGRRTRRRRGPKFFVLVSQFVYTSPTLWYKAVFGSSCTLLKLPD